MVRAFVTGVITGGVLVAVFGRRILGSIDARTRTARLRVADTVGKTAEGLETAKGVIEGGLTGEDRSHEGEP